MSYLSLDEINSNPIYLPPAEWIFPDYKTLIDMKFKDHEGINKEMSERQIADFETLPNDRKVRMMYLYKNKIPLWKLKRLLNVHCYGAMSYLNKVYRTENCGRKTPYYYDVAKLYTHPSNFGDIYNCTKWGQLYTRRFKE